MDVKEFLHHAHDRAVEFKRSKVQDNGAKAPMPFVVVANRGSEHIATFFPQNRDPMLWTMRLAVGAFGCDLVAGTVDAFRVESAKGPDGEYDGLAATNPDTGQPWAPGDMQRAFDRGRPWVTEELMTHAIDRVERMLHARSQAYVAKRNKIDFAEPKEIESLGGIVPDALREAMDAPDMMAQMNRLIGQLKADGQDPFEDMSSKEKRAHADCAALRLCISNEIPVLYNVEDPDVRGIVEMSLGDEERNAEAGVPNLKMFPFIGRLQEP